MSPQRPTRRAAAAAASKQWLMRNSRLSSDDDGSDDGEASSGEEKENAKSTPKKKKAARFTASDSESSFEEAGDNDEDEQDDDEGEEADGKEGDGQEGHEEGVAAGRGGRRGGRGAHGAGRRPGRGSRGGRDGREVREEQAESSPRPPPPQRLRPTPSSAARPASLDVHRIPPYPQDGRNTRTYAGPLKKWDRFRTLVEMLYGPDRDAIRIINGLRQHWADYPVLPRSSNGGSGSGSGSGPVAGSMMASPWLPGHFEAQQAQAHRVWFEQWYRNGDQQQKQHSHRLAPADGRHYLPWGHDGSDDGGPMVVLMGPAASQTPVTFRPGECRALQDSGLPTLRPSVDDGGGSSSKNGGNHGGWMMDVCGVVVAMAWAPLAGRTEQLLALAVQPHRDHEAATATAAATAQGDSEEETEGDKRLGSIQIWRVPLPGTTRGPSSSPSLPQLERVYCFHWGRPRRLQWCPIPLEGDGSVAGLLAVLTTDGVVRILEVGRGSDPAAAETVYERIEKPMAALGLLDEYNVTATCLSWVAINRIVLGHHDGSLTLWSVRPLRMLLRHAAHTSQVLDVCSGYPSYPYMVASLPVGGLARLVDLTRPGSEHTFHPSPVVGFQSGLLHWSDHMLGFAAPEPSNNPLSSHLSFLHVRFFAISRPFFSSRGPVTAPTCLSLGAAHPYALIGRVDGSLWACNLIRKVFPDRAERLYRLQVLEHEFRPYRRAGDGGGVRHRRCHGAARILQGFEAELSQSRRAAEAEAKRRRGEAQGEGEDVHDTNDDNNNDDDDDDDEDNEEDDVNEGPAQTTVHDPLTRISAVAWNPNTEFGWWAAAATASGLVRILDLGVAV